MNDGRHAGARLTISDFTGEGNQQFYVERLDNAYRMTGFSSKNVIDVFVWSRDNGGRIQVWPWHGDFNQRWDIVPNGKGWYYIKGKQSKKVLDVTNGSTDSGTYIQQWDYSGSPNQLFKFQKVEIIPNGYYYIINKHSNKVLEVPNDARHDGARLVISDLNGKGNQKFKIERLDNAYRITGVNNGKVVDVYFWTREDGGKIHMWNWHGDYNQRWDIVPNGKGWYYIKSKHSKKVLEVANGSSTSGTFIQQMKYLGRSNQLFKFKLA